MTLPRRALVLLATVGLFAAGLRWLDERRVACGALPVRALATDASSAAATSALALDAAAETVWTSEGGEDAWWRVEFPRPLVLRGVSVDTGNHVGDSAALLPLGLRPEDGSRGSFQQLHHRRRFRIWHEFSWEPVAVGGLVLRAVPGTPADRGLTLRDVRLLPADAAQAAALPGGVPSGIPALRDAWLPLLLACAWAWLVTSSPRAKVDGALPAA